AGIHRVVRAHGAEELLPVRRRATRSLGREIDHSEDRAAARRLEHHRSRSARPGTASRSSTWGEGPSMTKMDLPPALCPVTTRRIGLAIGVLLVRDGRVGRSAIRCGGWGGAPHGAEADERQDYGGHQGGGEEERRRGALVAVT